MLYSLFGTVTDWTSLYPTVRALECDWAGTHNTPSGFWLAGVRVVPCGPGVQQCADNAALWKQIVPLSTLQGALGAALM